MKVKAVSFQNTNHCFFFFLVRKRSKKKNKKASDQSETDRNYLEPEVLSPIVYVSIHSTPRSFNSTTTNTRATPDSNANIKKSIRRILFKSFKKHHGKFHPVYELSYTPWERCRHRSITRNTNSWMSDTASRKCHLCLVSFSLTRCRHHCRLCGLLVCRACSGQRTSIPVIKGDKVKTLRGQRTCTSCGNTLNNMALQGDKRVRKLSFQNADEDETERAAASAEEYCFSPVMHHHDHDRAHPTHTKDCLNRTDELYEILQARNFLKGRSASNQYIISTEWLEQWLQYVNIDSAISLLGTRSFTQNLMKRCSFPHRKLRTKRPGPISNYCLLDFFDGKLTPKENLSRSVGDENGHYHVISQEIWHVFQQFYGGGPSIKLEGSGMSPYLSPGQVSMGYIVIDPSDWSILEVTQDRLTTRIDHSNDHSTHKTKRLHRIFSSRQRRILCNDEKKLTTKKNSSGETSPSVTDTTGSMSFDSRSDDSGELKSSCISRTATCLSQHKSSWHSILHPSKRLKAQGRSSSSSTQPLGRFWGNSDLSGSRKTISFGEIRSQMIYSDEEDLKAYCQRDTIAAVFAFAEAASEARKKSAAMCLRRHSCEALKPP